MSEKSAIEQMKHIAVQSKLNSIVLRTRTEAKERRSIIDSIFHKRKISESSFSRSKIGGLPDVPGGFLWPKWEDKSLSFIAQINLAEVKRYDTDDLLPSDGMLYFFYHQNQETWGYDPHDKGSWSVLCYNGDMQGLHQTLYPEDLEEGARFQECSLEFTEEASYPDYESFIFESIADKYEYADEYFEWRNSMQKRDDQIINKLLGHPDQIQGEMQTECQLVSNGLYCGDSSGYKDPRAEILRDGAGDWQLLLQIDSDDKAGMMWGDVGRLYFWIKKEDLRNRRFDNTWMILQCG